MLKKNLIVLFVLSFQFIFSQSDLNVLVYSKTGGFRHKSIPAGKEAFKLWGKQENWKVSFSEEPSDISNENLKNIDVIVFLNTTNDVLDSLSRKAFKKFINNGGGYVGIHAASDTEFHWPWYYQMVGAYFKNHPKVQEATMLVNKETNHPAITHFNDTFTVKDEWYNFKDDVLNRVNVLLTLDDSSYSGKNKDESHPISWYQYYEGGRVFYTGMGHTNEIYKNLNFIKHVKNGVEWAGKRIDIPLQKGWQNLLDKDLSKWDVFIGSPHKSVILEGYDKSDDGKSGKPIGFNKDPKKVFSTIDENGETILKISGEIYGGLSTREEYGNYHLKAQFKWGNKKWAPRLNRKMDNGILYHCKGIQGTFWNVWMNSLEFQVQDGDCGDFYALGVYGDVPSKKLETENGKKQFVFTPGTTVNYAKSKKLAPNYVKRSKSYEKPIGEWNTFELICVGDTSLHIVNGYVVNVIKNARFDRDGKTFSVKRGKIQIQSEGAEAYYKNIKIQPVSKFPRKYKRQAKL
ncbi:ThuA domain-containing protein [Polaribacter septentrionalilitoris]|uniref:ThuA domain-containing protein n=1 Tax=Polaribacter septentrionalilitoris TaxID=2494657 RepID=UPI00135AA5E9|nr:ThuA domain-containing protein [Polaribacter septentrionalilitoris]